MKKKRMRGIESLKSMYGRIFLIPWLVGLALFFIFPLLQSFAFSFLDVGITVGGLKLDFLKFENFNYVWREDPSFTANLKASLGEILYRFPLTICLSLFLAIILNEKFVGRTAFRAVYFMPVIIATGVVMKLILSTRVHDAETMGMATSLAEEMIKIDDIVNLLDLPAEITEIITSAVNAIMNLIWDTGIQTVLFISGMQSIPELLYEVSKVEGANRWQEFWFITFPMLVRVLMVVAIFTLLEIMTSTSNKVMGAAYNFMESQKYGVSSAMLWSYFIIIGLILGIIFIIYSKANRRWNEV